jgi:chorismate-pyruvate lyase
MDAISKKEVIEPSNIRDSVLIDLALNNDGSVVQLLSTVFKEPISIELLKQKYCRISSSQWDDVDESEGVMLRNVFLKGKNTDIRYVYASSLIRIDKLPSNFADDLLNQQLGIGEIINKYEIETYRKVVDTSLVDSHIMHAMFSVKGDISCRTYKIYINNAPAMLITEYYPNELFKF